MSFYFLILIIIVAAPLILGFESRLKYYTKFPALFCAIIVVGSVYVFWDAVATQRGDWAFHPQYVSGLRYFSLPVEEILFFAAVPFSCLFIYECLGLFARDKVYHVPRIFWTVVALIFIVAAYQNREQIYTFKAMLSCALALFYMLIFQKDLLNSRRYWIYMLVCYVPFVIFNGILTGLPVVIYNPDAIWNIRILSIPLEDFFYNYSMLSFYAAVYVLFVRLFRK